MVEWTAQSEPYTRPDAATLINRIRDTVAGRAEDVVAGGICVPGIFGPDGRTIALAVNVPGLVGTPLDSIVAKAVGRPLQPLHIVNDAEATADDAIRSLQLKGRVACIALGTGVGVAVLDDGRALHVEGHSPGHVGQIDVSLDDDAPIGPDGGRGSLEAYIGVPALIARNGTTQRFLDTASPDAVPLRALARAIRIIHAIYRPDHIVLAGGVGIRLGHVVDGLQAEIAKDLTSVARRTWQLHCGWHDFHAAIGAARLASHLGAT
jgi:predicted NBD/HSP70 family sugar kinase